MPANRLFLQYFQVYKCLKQKIIKFYQLLNINPFFFLKKFGTNLKKLLLQRLF
jgi:hypothetical protein